KIMSEYFSCNSQRKNEIKLKFINLQKEILEKTISAFGKNTGELTLKLTTWNPFSNTSNSWFDPEWMFGLEDKFDIVIGNPPYGAKLDKEIKKDFIYSANGKIESYRIFIEKALQMDKKSGVVTFIVPNTWMYIEQALPLRQYLLKNTEIKVLATLPQSTFTASVDSMVFLLKNNLPDDNKSLVFEIPLKNSLSTIDLHLKEGKLFNQDEWLNSDKSIIAIGQDNALYKVIAKLKNRNQKFSDFVYIKQGLIPYLTKEEGKENKYISKNKEGEDWDKYFDGSRCIDRYSTKGVISYIKYGDWLYAPREQDIFRKPRIIYQLIRNISLKRRIVATYLDEEIYSDRNTGLIFTKPGVKVELKYILGILNSKLINFIHSKSHNSTYVSFPSIESLPFVLGDESFQQKIISLVNEILEIKTKDRKSNVDDFESQIDRLVYKLYGLTDEEIKIVESK
ncbi:MAG: Eco57I restriction-modification methylase domain-containing protein, partial [bacterium]|nr:Eco57I restriction-modification methylase domain-containing protein [bacterium]